MPITKLNLKGLTKTKTTGTEYPKLPSTPDLADLVGKYIDGVAEMDALKGSNELMRAEICELARSFYFEFVSGKTDIPSSVEVRSTDGRPCLVAFPSRAKAVTDEKQIADIIGTDLTSQLFYDAFELKINGDKIPEHKAQDLVNQVVTLFDEAGATDALTAKQVIKPSPEFHTARHSKLSVDQNLALDEVCPIIMAVKTKGRK